MLDDYMLLIGKLLELRKTLSRYDQIELTKVLNERNDAKPNGDAFITAHYLNKFLKWKEGRAKIAPRTLATIIETFEALISGGEYKGSVQNKNDYQSVSKSTQKSNRIDVDRERLQGLTGTYEGFLWDAGVTRKKKNESHIHVFKIHINNIEEIQCETKGGKFGKGAIFLLGTEKILIELIEDGKSRKLFLMMEIPSASGDVLKRKKQFHVGYVDSGYKKIKAGLAILERTSTPFHQIEIGNKPSTYLEENNKDETILKFIEKAQVIVDIGANEHLRCEDNEHTNHL